MEAILPTLFDGAYNCTAASTSGGDVVNFNADWSLNFACLSVLPMYLAKGEGCPVSRMNGKCPFGWIEKSSFWMKEASIWLGLEIGNSCCLFDEWAKPQRRRSSPNTDNEREYDTSCVQIDKIFSRFTNQGWRSEQGGTSKQSCIISSKRLVSNDLHVYTHNVSHSLWENVEHGYSSNRGTVD